MIAQLFTICYLAGMATALLKSTRCWLDYRRSHRRFYLVGLPANLALALALALIAIGTGDDPAISRESLRFLLRGSFMAWALLGLLFEVLYMRSFLEVKKQ